MTDAQALQVKKTHQALQKVSGVLNTTAPTTPGFSAIVGEYVSAYNAHKNAVAAASGV